MVVVWVVATGAEHWPSTVRASRLFLFPLIHTVAAAEIVGQAFFIAGRDPPAGSRHYFPSAFFACNFDLFGIAGADPAVVKGFAETTFFALRALHAVITVFSQFVCGGEICSAYLTLPFNRFS